MKNHSFEIQDTRGFLKLGDWLYENKIGKIDSVIIKVRAKNPVEYKEVICSLFNMPGSYCGFIKSCRQGVNNFSCDTTFLYPESGSQIEFGKKIGDLLTQNTGINISFERIGNDYEFDLSAFESSTIREAASKIEYFIISNSIVSGDSFTLKINEKKLSHLTQSCYYILIGQALNMVGDMFKIPSMTVDLADNFFEETEVEKSELPFRLAKQSGINFTFAAA